ncbi:MAG TPA: biopolymer transporter ExbD [Bryobacteraceae bacterium]|jgi:biopolymer transport protein ExbD
MAFSTGSSNGRYARRRGASIGVMAEMNIVPLVDVVLVLLIVFMLTAHVMDYGLDIQVPKVKAAAQTAEDLPIVSVSKSGDVSLNEQKVKLALLGSEVQRRFKNAKSVFVRADGRLTWETLAQVISQLKQDNLEIKMVLTTEESGK